MSGFPRADIMVSYSVALVIVVVLGFLATFFPIHILIGTLVLFAWLGWVWWSQRHLLGAFVLTLFVVILASSRLEVQILSLQGADRGFVSLADLLWLGLIISFSLRGTKVRFSRSILGLLPYIALAIALPIGGVIGGFPLNYITPAIRIFQWASFGYMAYVLGKEYGVLTTFRRISSVILWASMIHFLYAAVQYAASAGFISSAFLRFDQIYAATHEVSWFYYPRLTGLFVNPNTYGLFCALAALLAVALLVVQPQWINTVFTSFVLLVSLIGILLSGSRSGFLGFLVGFLGITFVTLQRASKVPRLIKIIGVLCLIATLCFTLLPVVPGGEIMLARFAKFLDIAREGVAVAPNALARVEMWKEAWKTTATYYPFGTGVPPSYALGMPIDSYYVVTLVQGSFLFTIAFIIALFTVVRAGYACWRLPQPTVRALGLAVFGYALVMATGSLFLSPPLQPFLIIPFWSLAGLAFAGKRDR